MITDDNEETLLRTVALHNAESIRLARQRAERQTEAALREQAALLDLTHDAVLVRGLDRTIRYWNRGAEEMYGWVAEEVLGKPAPEVLHTISAVPLEDVEAEVLRTGRWKGELEQTTKRGTQVVVASRWALQRDERGAPVAMLVTNTDITERKRAEQARQEIEELWRASFESNPTMYFIVDAGGTTISVNPFGAQQLGYEVSELVGQPVLNVFYEPDRALVQGHAERCFANPGRLTRWEARKVRKDGTMLWVRETANAVFLKKRLVLLVICEDITEQKRAEALLAGEKRILEMVAKGEPLAQVLDELCRLVEELAPGVLASVLLLQGNRLKHGGAPSLPKAYTEAIDGALIGPSAGSCGTAAFRAEQVIVRDIATDPLWADYRAAALPHGLRACWSTPVFSPEGKVIASFAMYYREPRAPDPADQEIIEQIGHLAGVAIQHRLAAERLAESEAYLAEAQRIGNTGSWAWNATTGTRYWSEQCFRIIGFEPGAVPPQPESWMHRIHADDRTRFIEQREKAIRDKTDYDVQFRLVQPGGELRDIHLLGRPVRRPSGDLEFVGTVMDVTERKRAEQALRASEERFRTLVQFSFDSYWETDAQHRFVRLEFAEGLANAPAVDAEIGKTRWEVPYVEPGEEGWRLHRSTVQSHQPFRDFEVARPTPDGGKRYMSVSGLPVFDEAGRFIGYRGVGRDITERKRAEEALRRSEAYLAEAQKLSHTGSWARDMVTGKTTHSSEEHSRLFGFDPEGEVPSFEAFFERIHPEDRAGIGAAWEEAIRRRTDFETHFRTVMPDGTIKYIHGTGHPVFDAAGDLVEYIGTAVDVTERRRAEEELRASEARFRSFVDHAADGFMLHEGGKVVEVNRQACEMLGYSRDELIGMEPTAWDLNASPEYLERLRQRIATEETVTFESRFRRKDGSVFPAEVRVRELRHGGRHFSLSLTRDITERERAEHLIRQAFESAPDSMAVVGKDYRYIRVNPIYERNWAIPAERIVGMHVADLMGMEFFEQSLKPNLDRCLAGEHVLFAEWVTNTRGRHYMSVSYSPLRLESEHVDAALVIARDLTEQMLASEALREAQGALARVNRVTTLGVLAASIAHEVNQPLAAMVTSASSCARWLSAHPPDFDKARRALERIAKDGVRASQVIDRIRTLVKRQAPRRDRVDINEAIHEVMALTRDEVRRHDISLQASLATDLPYVEGDAIQIQQVILNLIVNAIEAMSGNGGPRELAIASARDANAVRVEVRDSGPGVDPQRAEQLFEAFYTSKANGIGMGLSISRSIIEAHGGRLWVTPNVPHGAAFQFSLPLEAPGA